MKEEDLYKSPLKKDATATVKAKLKKEKQGEADLMSKGKHVSQLLDKYRKPEVKKEEMKEAPKQSIDERMNSLSQRMLSLSSDIKKKLQGE